MKGSLTVLLVFLVCLVVVVLYIFLGRSQIAKVNANLRTQNDALQQQLDKIAEKEKELPELMARLPQWSRQLSMFNQAIPTEVDDNVFFAGLAAEAKKRNVQILKLETSVGTPWLGQINDEMATELEALGINVDAARSVKVAFYSSTMVGKFQDILGVFEAMKGYNRLYTLEQVTGPAQTGMGTSSDVIQEAQTPLTFSGKLYYGIGEKEVSQETLASVFSKAVSGPAARTLFNGVKKGAKDLSETTTPDKDKSDATGDQAGAPDVAPRKIAAVPPGCITSGGREGWIR